MLQRVSILVLALAAATGAAQAQQAPGGASGGAVVASEPGRVTVADAVQVTATVTALDAAQRLVTLKGPDGRVFSVQAGPEVTNFAQIKVGDKVVTRYMEALTLDLKKGGGKPVERVETTAGAKAAPGERPGAGGARKVTVVADVVSVDAARQTIRVKGPERSVDLKVRDPAQFKLVKVGDQVEATFTEALALSVEPAK
jgi:hypothetical protein